MKAGIAGVWPHGDPNAIMHEILAQPAFRDLRVSGDAELSLLERAIKWLGDLGGPIFRRLFEGIAGNSAAGSLVVVVLYVIAGLSLIFLVATLAQVFLGWSEQRERAAAVRGREESTSSPEALQREASAAAAAGDYARAIALLFRAALFVLDKAALLAFDAARTPGEYRRLVDRKAAVAAPPFEVLVTRFIYATFGTTNASRGDYEAAERAYVTFLPLAAMP